MRLDVFLKTSRMVKRRSVAKQMCDDGRVKVGGAEAKPGREIRPGDVITIELSRRVLDAEVLETPSGNVPKERAAELYRIVGEKPVEREPF